MSDAGATRRLTTIVAADVAGYSRLVAADEEGTLADLRAHRAALIDPQIAAAGGRIANTAGDSLLVEFPSAVEAIRCAVGIQEGMARRNEDMRPERRIELRMGINIGDVIEQDGDLLGDGVNVAARLEALADPGGICLSRAVRDQVRDKVDIALEDLGEIEVKNIARPVRTFRVRMDDDRIGDPERYRAPPRQRATIASAVFVAVIIALGLWWWQQQRPDFTPADPAKFAYALPDKPSIAVLPFDNLSGEKNQDFLADSFSENIIAALSRSPFLFVIARNSTFVYKGKPTKVQTVAEDLGVRYVLEGSVQRAGDTLRVTAQLVDAVNGKHLWADRYDRKLADASTLFAIQDDIARNIGRAMNVALVFGESVHRAYRNITDPEDLRQLGLAEQAFQTWSPDGNRTAHAINAKLLNAYSDDPNLLSQQGWVHWQKVIIRISENPAADFAEARRLAERALAIDDAFAQPHLILGGIELIAGRHDSALDHASRAEAAEPGVAAFPIGWIRVHSGQAKAGVDSLRHAMRISPQYPDWVPMELAEGLIRLGRYDEAKRILAGVLASPHDQSGVRGWTLRLLAAISVFEGDVSAARDFIQRAMAAGQASSIAAIKTRIAYDRDKAYLKRLVDALRQAGVPEE